MRFEDGIGKVKSFLKRFGSDITKVLLTADLPQAVKFHKVYAEMLEVEKQSERQKRRSSDEREASTKRAHLQEDFQLEQRIISSRTMLEHAPAHSLIELGLEKKERIESGQVL